MTMMAALAGSHATVAPAKTQRDDYVLFSTFDGAPETTQIWHELNDPVMGGQSSGSFTVDVAQGVGIFNGTARIVPSLSAPGFCNAETYAFQDFPDGSGYDNIFLVARTTVPNYKGFKLSFAADTLNPQFKSFKSPIKFQTTDWEVINVPLTEFSNDWSSFTGDCFTTDPNGKEHRCCSPQNPDVCPKSRQLNDISQFGLWAEGYAGDFQVEIKAIGAGTYSL